MSLPELKHPGYTIEDWKTWDGRWELIHGVPYDMTPAPGPEHQRISGQLSAAISSTPMNARASCCACREDVMRRPPVLSGVPWSQSWAESSTFVWVNESSPGEVLNLHLGCW